MDLTNKDFAYNLLFTDPINGEELRLEKEPITEDGILKLFMTRENNSAKWLYKLSIEEI